jgi:ribosomal protein S15
MARARRARFRGYNTDLSKVAQFKRDAGDVGSTEVQVAQLTARVSQLTTHLQEHRKDFACRRGLVILLGQRRRLMKYLYMTNRRAPCVSGVPRALVAGLSCQLRRRLAAVLCLGLSAVPPTSQCCREQLQRGRMHVLCRSLLASVALCQAHCSVR